MACAVRQGSWIGMGQAAVIAGEETRAGEGAVVVNYLTS